MGEVEAEAENLRIEGNEHFRAKRYHNAINSYTKSLQCRITTPALSNRAQAYLCLKQNEKALMDAKKAVMLDPSSVKARYRHAMALIKLELFELAMKDLETILEIDPNNKETVKLKESIKDKKNAKEVRLVCVDKCDTIRSEVPLKELTDIEVIGKVAKPNKIPVNNTVRLPSHTAPSAIPNAPSTSYQFLFDYASLKEHPEAFAKYFLSIETAAYDQILGEVVETDMIGVLVNGYHRIFTSDNFNDLVESLLQLGSVSRFQIAAMFLDAQDKRALRELLDRGELDVSRRDLLEQLYGL